MPEVWRVDQAPSTVVCCSRCVSVYATDAALPQLMGCLCRTSKGLVRSALLPRSSYRGLVHAVPPILYNIYSRVGLASP